jgi:hypothetical protein
MQKPYTMHEINNLTFYQFNTLLINELTNLPFYQLVCRSFSAGRFTNLQINMLHIIPMNNQNVALIHFILFAPLIVYRHLPL